VNQRAEDRPAKFGPFHRRQFDPDENEKICASGQIWGRPPRYIYAGLFPAVKAWNGSLPEGIAGVEFYTNVQPDPGTAPSSPQWTEGHAGVIILEKGELVAIEVVVTKRVDLD
jgi:hypothetical protein